MFYDFDLCKGLCKGLYDFGLYAKHFHELLEGSDFTPKT